MESTQFTLDWTVAEVLDYAPQLAAIFWQQRLFCVGCSMARFDTLRDVTRIYGLAPDALLRALNAAVVVEEG